MIDELIEVEDAIDAVAEALVASDCKITGEVLEALLHVMKASQRLSVAHFLFPAPSDDLEQLYLETQLDVGDLFHALRSELAAFVAQVRVGARGMIPTEYVDVRDTVELALKVDLHGTPSEMKCGAVEFWVCAPERDRRRSGVCGDRIRGDTGAPGRGPCVAGRLDEVPLPDGGPGCVPPASALAPIKTMPLVDEASERGEITGSHVEYLHRAQQLVGEEAFAQGRGALLVDAAVEQRFTDFVRTLEYFVVRVQPGDAESRARQALDDRYASSSRTFGGNGVVDAQFDPIGFTLWDAELRRCYDALYLKDRAEAKERLGRRPLDTELGRTARQRRCDAMLLMAERSAAHGDAELGPSRFTLLVHGDAELVGRTRPVHPRRPRRRRPGRRTRSRPASSTASRASTSSMTAPW